MQLTKEMLRLIDKISPEDIRRFPLLKVNEEVGDRVVGDLPEGLRKAYVFYRAARHDLKQIHKRLQDRLDKAKTKKMAERISMEIKVTQLMFDHTKRNFFDELRYLFPELIDEKYIAIRADSKGDWKVVVFMPSTSLFFCYLGFYGKLLNRKKTKHL